MLRYRDTRGVAVPGIAIRPFSRNDLPRLSGWLAQPHVARWWCEPANPAAVEARYLPCLDGRDPTELFVMEADGLAAGFMQRYLISDDPDWLEVLEATGVPGCESAAGIDYLIGDPALTGRGVGTAAIVEFTQLTLSRYPGITGVIADVAQANAASWRALEKAGYRRRWAGELNSSDPSDAGPQYLYRKDRTDSL